MLTHTTNPCFKSTRHQFAQELEMLLYNLGQKGDQSAKQTYNQLHKMLGGTVWAESALQEFLVSATAMMDEIEAVEERPGPDGRFADGQGIIPCGVCGSLFHSLHAQHLVCYKCEAERIASEKDAV